MNSKQATLRHLAQRIVQSFVLVLGISSLFQNVAAQDTSNAADGTSSSVQVSEDLNVDEGDNSPAESRTEEGESVFEATGVPGVQILLGDGTHPLRIGAKPKLFYTAVAESEISLSSRLIEQVVKLSITVVQGKPNVLTFGLSGSGEVVGVDGEKVRAWSVRQEGDRRFLDLTTDDSIKECDVEIRLQSLPVDLPTESSLLHLTPGDAVSFESNLHINASPTIYHQVLEAEGFAPITDLCDLG